MTSPGSAASVVNWTLPLPIVKVRAPSPLLVPPALLLVVKLRPPDPEIVIGALTTIEWKAESVSSAFVLHEIAASTLMSPAPLEMTPGPLAVVKVVCSATPVPPLRLF